MAKTTTNLTALTINYLTQAQFDAAVSDGTIDANQIYLTPDASITGVTAGSGLSGGGTSGSVTINHSNSVTAKTSQALYPITFDAQGHITGAGTAVTPITSHNTAYLYVGTSSGTTNAATSNGNTYLILVDGGSATSRRKISGSTNISVSSDSSGNITITGPDLSSYATTSQIPTVPSNIVNTITTSAGTHTSISNKTGNVSFNIPTKTSHLTNDSGFLTSHQTAVTSLTTTAGSHSTKSSATGAVSIAIPTKTSHLTNDSGFITSYTDTKVTQTPLNGTNSGKNILLAYNLSNSGSTTADTNGVYKATYMTYNDYSPSLTLTNTSDSTKTSTLTSTGFSIKTGSYSVTISANTQTSNHTISLPDKAGTVALTSDIPTDSDIKLQVAEVSSNTQYYPIVGSGTTAATRQYDTTGFLYKGYTGTTSVVGTATLTLGNSTKSGTTGNKQGILQLYGTDDNYVLLKYAGTSNNREITFPDNAGTVALTSDIPTSLPASDVYSWAKASSKPSYTASEVGALSSSTTYVSTITTSAGTHSTISSKSGAVSFNVPTKTSHLTNDSGFITSYTDTKNTAGTSNKTGTKMYLAAATSQSDGIQTYSNSNCYIGTDNCLYSGGTKVLTSHQTITSSMVTTALGYTPYNSTNPNGYTSNTGTVTGVKINGTTKSPSSGVVDLGTVLTSHQTAVTSLTTTAGAHSTKSSATGAVSMAVPTKTSHLTNDSSFTTLQAVYPVGAIYISTVNTNPKTLFGFGEWDPIEGKFLLGADSTYTAGSSGGSPYLQEHTHTLSHTHTMAHTHGTGVSTAQYFLTTTATGSAGNMSGPSGTGRHYFYQSDNSSGNYWGHPSATGGSSAANTGAASNATTSNHNQTSGNTDQGNMPPYLAVYMWKRTA